MFKYLLQKIDYYEYLMLRLLQIASQVRAIKHNNI